MSLIVSNQEGQLLRIKLNRPEKKNALTFEMYAGLADALQQGIEDDDTKVILLEAEGSVFTAGNDLSDFIKATQDNNIAPAVQFMRTLLYCPKPVVAKVQGMALGIGTTMLLHCDFVISSNDTQFVLPFVNLGLVPEYASSYMLPRLGGHRKACEWLMLGEPFSAAVAQQFGLINRSVPTRNLEQTVTELVEKLMNKPTQALMQTKALLTTSVDDVAKHIDLELDIFIEQLHSDAAKEAFDAFLNKRPPDLTKYQ